MDVPGVPLREQQVTFDITSDEARTANAAQRTRLLDTVRALTDDQWVAGSRCSVWTVQDVVRHLAQMTDLMIAGVGAARRGEKFTPFASFDPRVTPAELVRDAGEQAPAETRVDFERATTTLIGALAELDDDSLLVPTPAGRQPWPRSVLHALWDSSVHERDITVPLGLSADGPAEEFGPIAAYQVLLASRVACMFGSSYSAELALDGAPTLTVRVDGPAVSVTRETRSGAPVGHGDVVAVLDAMAGRGELTDVLDAPAEVVAGLSTLRSLV